MKQPLPGIKFTLAFLLLVTSCAVFAQQDTAKLDSNAIYNMSLEQLMNLKETGVSSQLEAQINALIGVASKKSLSQRKSPSVVTVISHDEIERSGARDLIDVLRLVPGIDFGVDVQGNVSIIMRGNWAEEGKVLVLLDGQEMNELMYSTTQFGNHFDVSSIKRIEIIRGPGSAIYGGFAEYGVISIITKDGDDLKGISATGGYGQTARTVGYRDISLAIGDKINDFMYSVSGFVGHANRSDNTYTDFNGNSYSMAGNSNLDPRNVILKLSYKGLSFTGVYDNFVTTTADNFGIALSRAYPCNFLTESYQLKYDAKLGNKITLTPLISYKYQKPWNFSGTVAPADSAYTIYDKNVERYTGSLSMLYDVTRHINIVAGAEVFQDHAALGVDTTLFSNGKSSVSYTNVAAYAQVLFRYHIASIMLGARYDNNSAYGSSFVPRLGIMRKIDKWNFKLLYNNSFRAPGIEDINFSYEGQIKPETTTVIEFEVGKEISTDMFVTLNVFDITTKNPIVYYVDTVLNSSGSYNEGYKNLNEQGTRGAELDYRIKETWGYFDLNYAFYTTAGKTVVPAYQVPGNSDMTLGAAANKINLSFSYNITPSLFITPTISWIGQRYGYVDSNSSGIPALKKFSPTTLANIYLMYKVNKLKIGVGCYNILNADYEFIQPYNGGHAPLPSMSREYEIRVSYDLNFKK